MDNFALLQVWIHQFDSRQTLFIFSGSTGVPVVQLIKSKPFDVGTWVRIPVQSHESGFFLSKEKKRKKDAQQVEND